MTEETVIELPDIKIDIPEYETRGFVKRQRKLIRLMARLSRARGLVSKFDNQPEASRDYLAIAEAMEEVADAQDAIVAYLAEFVLYPEEHDDKIEALEMLSQKHYDTISQAILNPDREGDDDENPTE